MLGSSSSRTPEKQYGGRSHGKSVVIFLCLFPCYRSDKKKKTLRDQENITKKDLHVQWSDKANLWRGLTLSQRLKMAPLVVLFRSPTAPPAEDEYHKVRNMNKWNKWPARKFVSDRYLKWGTIICLYRCWFVAVTDIFRIIFDQYLWGKLSRLAVNILFL